MASVCSCGSLGFDNTGTPNCQSIASVTRKLVFVPYFDSTGAVNSIDLTVPPALDKAWFDAQTANTDASKRWYPTPLIDNVTDERGDAITEGLDSGKEIFIQEGTRNFSGVMIKQSPVLLGKLKSIKCSAVGVFVIDKDGNLMGSISDDGNELQPIRIDENTFYPRLIKTTDTTVGKIQLDFAFSDIEADEDLRMILASEMSYDALLLKGMLDVNSSATTGTALGDFTTLLTLDYGSALNPKKVEGLVSADFTLYNETTAGTVTITSVTESPAGTYAVDFTGDPQTASDVLELRFDAAVVKNYEMASNSITLS